MTRIVAIDLGKFKSVACTYDSETAESSFRTVATTPAALHELFVELQPEQIVIEICGIAGWIHDLARSLELRIDVVDTRHEAWRWKKVKRKTDRDDALKLARLASMQQISTVHIPERKVRQWKSLIVYRHTLVDRRTAIKNTIRALLDVQGERMPGGAKGWTRASRKRLEDMARRLETCDRTELWRGQLELELRALDDLGKLIEEVEAKLDRLACADDRVRQLKSAPGIGNRFSELMVATVDCPERFASGRKVGAYVGIVPRQFESGTMSRSGRITHQGPGLLRRLAVQIAWGMERRSPRVAALFERLSGGQKSRRKKAAVAIARKILVWCWAMLRDGTTWQEFDLAAA